MFKLSEYRQSPDRITDLLPWAIMVRSNIILNKDGSFQKTLLYRGPDLASSTEAQLVSEMARLNNALRRLGSGWAIFIEARRDQAEFKSKSNSKSNSSCFKDPVSQLIDDERNAHFKENGLYFESQFYLTLQFLPPIEQLSKLSKWFVDHNHSQNSKNSQNSQAHQWLDQFEEQSERVFDILKGFLYEIKWLDGDDLLTYLHSCISEKNHKISVPKNPVYLDPILADTPLTGGFEPLLGECYLKTISITSFPSSTTPALLDQLNQLAIPYRWVTRYIPLDKLDAEKQLKSYRRKWFAKRKGVMTLLTEMFSKSESAMVDQSAVRKSQDADEALHILNEDFVSYGYYTATITVWDKDLEIAKNKLREVEQIINGLGFACINEKINAVDAWLSSLPGHLYANVRAPLVHSLNLSHMMPFSTVWAGPEFNSHLKSSPLFTASTAGSTPFRFSNHIGDVGHQMLIGPTGSGKSVLLNFMALQFLRYKNSSVFIFDKGESFLNSTLGVGGRLYNLGQRSKNKKLGVVFQPLKDIDQSTEKTWAHEWLLGLFAHEGIKLTPALKDVLWDALNSLANLPINQRTITGLKALIQDESLRLALEPYSLGGPFGDILDADSEQSEFEVNSKSNLKSKSNHQGPDWLCFEMEHLMDQPDIIAPVLNIIFHRLEKLMTGQPVMMILDEAWLFLDHPMFANKIKSWLKTLRKRNVSVIFATQSIDDLTQSTVASSLIESCPSRVFLPNDRALEPNIEQTYSGLGLNTKQIQIIAQSIPKKQYYFQSYQGNALFNLDLDPIAQIFTISGSTKDKTNIKHLFQTASSQENFIQKLLDQKLLDQKLLDQKLNINNKNRGGENG